AAFPNPAADRVAPRRRRGKDQGSRAHTARRRVAVTLRSIFFAGSLGLASVLGTAADIRAQDPVSEPRRHQLDAVAPMPSGVDNQQMADAIAAALRKHPEIRSYRIDVGYVGGVAELHGQVADSTQRDLVRQTVLSVPGVAQVRDRLQQVSQVEYAQE